MFFVSPRVCFKIQNMADFLLSLSYPDSAFSCRGLHSSSFLIMGDSEIL